MSIQTNMQTPESAKQTTAKISFIPIVNTIVACVNAKGLSGTEVLQVIHDMLEDTYPIHAAEYDISRGEMTETYQAHLSHMTGHSGQKYDKMSMASATGINGLTLTVHPEGYFPIFIIVVWPECTEFGSEEEDLNTLALTTLVHEVVHVANRVCANVGIKLPTEATEDEFIAYLVDYIFSEFRECFVILPSEAKQLKAKAKKTKSTAKTTKGKPMPKTKSKAKTPKLLNE